MNEWTRLVRLSTRISNKMESPRLVESHLITPGSRVLSHLQPGIHPHFTNLKDYREAYERSVQEPEEFWAEQSKSLLTWRKPFSTVLSGNFGEGDAKWFLEGTLNAAENAVDRHAQLTPNKVALIWESDEPGNGKQITYAELKKESSRVAAYLQSQGLKKGDRVTIYMPMILETVYSMLACARLGLVHNVVFAGFSVEALRDRIEDAQSEVVLTADYGRRGGKSIPLKAIVDEALISLDGLVRRVVVYKRSEEGDGSIPVTMREGRDIWWQDAMNQVQDVSFVEPVEMASEDPLFMLYTSGSTGKPKGLLHTTGGYLTYVALTSKISFDLHSGDILGCLADVGWITGHSYVVYGPLINGVTSVIFESTPLYPSAGRYWDVVDRLKITQLYTAPTVIRALRKFGEDPVKPYNLSSLRVLGSVGEPINPDAWLWYHRVVGKEECSVIDTYWQTETGGHLITTIPAVHSAKPGSAGFPALGIDAVLLDATTGHIIEENDREGVLAIRQAWPGLARTIFGDHERFRKTYFSIYPGYYFTGDAAFRDSDGYLWIRGRVDDVINVSGHRLGTAEIEAILGRHGNCAEAAVLGRPDDVTGQSIWAFCILKGIHAHEKGVDLTKIRRELIQLVRSTIGPFAAPKYIILTNDLPKTRSGKIMRRLLRKILAGETDSLGDLSTLTDPAIIGELIEAVRLADENLGKQQK